MNSGEPIRVAIVEDDRSTCQGLALLIGGTPGYECVGQFRSVEDALRLLESAPQVLLLDIHLPGMPGSDGVKLLRAKYPSMQVVMLTVFAEQEKVFESICNGACGYLLKKTAPAKLLEAIAEAHEGGSPMSPEIARKVVILFQKMPPTEKPGEPLTPQEVRLLGFLAEGYSYQKAAARLDITVNTIRNYIRSIYAKLHVHSKSEAVIKAFRNRIIS
jgi:DNA-binding NarL/FixJ family response regulator